MFSDTALPAAELQMGFFLAQRNIQIPRLLYYSKNCEIFARNILDS
jgi:hypothetical protein